jgi:hypothetical protein
MLGVSNSNCLVQLWDYYTQSTTKKFPLSNVLLTLSNEKLDEIRSKFSESPVKTLPQISILQDLKLKTSTFDSELAKDLPPTNYFPLVFDFESSEDSFEKYMLHQVCCDLIYAFG